MSVKPAPDSQTLDPRHLDAIRLSEPQSHRHITLFPLVSAENGSPEYVPLSEALASRQVTVTEVSQSGSVPELKVSNTSDTAVLLLDGEELSGAKQNRVLNTSILLRAKSEAVIPVSCTEQGRWNYSSACFAHSGVVMSRKARAFKSSSVSESLKASAQYHSDQGGVWEHIQALHQQAGTSSRTSAMLDAFKAHEANLGSAMEAFPAVDGQHGLLVVVNGQVAGLDWVSRSAAYRQLHPNLLKSYVFDALIEPTTREVPTNEARSQAEAFLQQIRSLAGRSFPSVGLGSDHRFQSKDLAGSALIHEDHLIHLGFFRLEPEESGSPMAGMRTRRRWRME